MPTRYFKLSDDMAAKGRWLLGAPTDLKGFEVEEWWIFTDGVPVPNRGPLKFPVDVPGRALDFSLAAFGIPVIHVRVASLLAQLAPSDVQILPVEIQGQPDEFCILVATKLIRCIDDAACREVERWTPEDERPEKVGQYRDISGLRIDPLKVGEAKVFRLWGWSIALVVSEEIKAALDRIGATGTKFTEV
ncbi:hypothetical protein [Pyxidicoccus trucidator]|uniref:hypothetical protein n=1 Tax=Pyxidicoccus trucidator TaxID=2709662 RepID=UPI0013DC1F35|nr:hypothetical protein [Pyxidicoccus trucidator]